MRFDDQRVGGRPDLMVPAGAMTQAVPADPLGPRAGSASCHRRSSVTERGRGDGRSVERHAAAPAREDRFVAPPLSVSGTR